MYPVLVAPGNPFAIGVDDTDRKRRICRHLCHDGSIRLNHCVADDFAHSLRGADSEIRIVDGTVNANNSNLFGFNNNAGVSGFTPGATDVVPGAGVNLTDILDPLAANGGPTLTHALVTGSPAIDAAGNGCSSTDQRGYDRTAVLPCDIGAFEVVAAAVPSLSCQGFEPPMDAGLVTVKKSRALPLKAQLFDNGNLITDADITAPPVIQVIYTSTGGGSPTDVTDDAVPAGQGTDGNQFAFNIDKWQFNLKTKNYTVAGIYTVTMVSGDDAEYVVDPNCIATFAVE